MKRAILLVDDDASVTTSLALLLKQAGYASESAANPDISHGKQIGLAGWEKQHGHDTLSEIVVTLSGRDLVFDRNKAVSGWRWRSAR